MSLSDFNFHAQSTFSYKRYIYERRIIMAQFLNVNQISHKT